MAGFTVFLPFGVVTPDQFDYIFFRFDMGNAYKIINIPLADLAPVFHYWLNPFFYLMQSARQQQAGWSQLKRAVPKQSKLPSVRWMDLTSSFLDSLQVSLTPKSLALFSISESLILLPLLFVSPTALFIL